jgi:RNA polymerase sigma factor (sigma-70 family)
MGNANGNLRSVIVQRYSYLMAHLSRRLRSDDLASDALHDVYVYLGDTKEVPQVSNPVGFLLTAAMNRARNRQRSDNRLVGLTGAEAAFDNLVDETPNPAEAAEARSEFAVFERAFSELPPRRRAIFLASIKGKMSTREIAQRIGLSRRRVDVELVLAREHCARALLKNAPK